MCHTYEQTLTFIYHEDSDTWNVWVTGSMDGSQSEILCFLTDVPDEIRTEWVRLRNALIKASL